MGDLEFGDFLFAGIAGGIWGQMRSTAVSMDMLSACLLHVHIVKASDDLIGIDLWNFQHCPGPFPTDYGHDLMVPRATYMTCEGHICGILWVSCS